jgi:SAM-dependent methyltransferase
LNSQPNDRSPDYSPYARQYAQSRPGYPAELFSFLASLVKRHTLAWDCATGSGQAAFSLVEHFDRVIAIDISDKQIAHAAPHPQIEYRVATAEQSGLDDQSVDLVTVAAAVHWFDLDKFYAEVERVMHSGGVVAVWTYHIGHMEPPFDQLFGRFYRDVLAPYFPAKAQRVNDRYATITLPGQAITAPDFQMTATWTFDQLLGFINSWSGTQKYITDRGENPVSLIAVELEEAWGARDTLRTLRWPLYTRVARF